MRTSPWQDYVIGPIEHRGFGVVLSARDLQKDEEGKATRINRTDSVLYQQSYWIVLLIQTGVMLWGGLPTIAG